MIYEGQTRDVMIVINLNRCERKRPTADLYAAYGWGILFSLHQNHIASFHLNQQVWRLYARLLRQPPLITLYHTCLFRRVPKRRWSPGAPLLEPFWIKPVRKTIIRYLEVCSHACWPFPAEHTYRTTRKEKERQTKETKELESWKTEKILSNIDLS